VSWQQICEVLDSVRVNPDGRSAGFAAWRLEAREPRDLEKQLGKALYECLHLRRREPTDIRARMVRDPEFEHRLASRIPHRHLPETTSVVRRDTAGGMTLVRLMDVRVWVPDELVTDRSPDAAATVLLPSSFPALSPGFLMTQGTKRLPPGNPATLRRLYLSLRAAADAPAVWATVLGALEEAGLPYRAKAASVAWFYPRTDAVTVYVDARHLERATAALLPRLRRQGGLEPATSWLCERLAPGVAAASEPDDRRPGRRGLSFGEHRCSLLAHALVDARTRGTTWRELLPAVLEAANVDPDAPWRNLTGRTEPPEASPPPHEPAGPVTVRS
jgi:hypothetical protein